MNKRQAGIMFHDVRPAVCDCAKQGVAMRYGKFA